MYTLNSDFNIEMHKKTFINYLEVVIYPSGKVEYAVPSHQEKLISIAQRKHNWTREDIERESQGRWFDFLDWLIEVTGCICVWSDGYVGKPNRFQKKKLNYFIENCLMKGELIE